MKRFFCSLLAFVFAMTVPVAVCLAWVPKYHLITEELQKALDGVSANDRVDVYVVLQDIDVDTVMSEFESRYPEEYATYYVAKETDTETELRQKYYGNGCLSESSISHYNPVDPVLLQNAIEHKRAVFSEKYYAYNKSFIDMYAKSEDQIFISRYSPLMIVSLSKSEILHLSKESGVEYLDLFIDEPIQDALTVANQVTYAKYVRDTLGNTGEGVKIGQIEDKQPDVTVSSLSSASIILRNPSGATSDHATDMATIMVGTTANNKGVAVGATLYSCGVAQSSAFYDGCEWLIQQGVNIINASMSLSVAAGTYTPTITKWIDHIAVQHDIHFVAAAGNTGSDTSIIAPGTFYVTSPGMAYNAITVGALNDQRNGNGGFDYTNFLLYDYGSYRESDISNRPEKPNLIAPGVNVVVNGRYNTGTSVATAQVSGVVAQLCNFNTVLKVRQTVVGAMLAAGCVDKVLDTPAYLTQGTIFTSHISGSNQISDREGAGMLNAKTTRQVAANGRYWRATINSGNFPYSQNVYINSANNSLIRIAIFWLKRNSLSGTHLSGGSLSSISFSNLDLSVYAPDGSLVASSSTLYSNYEIVQFVPLQTGTYRIEINKATSNSSTKEFVGIAVW